MLDSWAEQKAVLVLVSVFHFPIWHCVGVESDLCLVWYLSR